MENVRHYRDLFEWVKYALSNHAAIDKIPIYRFKIFKDREQISQV